MYSRKRGKSSSTKPSKEAKPVWVRHKKKEVEILIQKLAKEGHTSSEIGIILRDSYGVPDVRLVTESSITQIMKEKNLLGELPEDLLAVIKKAVSLKKHYEENKQDKCAFRGFQLTESKIKRLVNYYKKVGKLPIDWKYDSESIKLYAE